MCFQFQFEMTSYRFTKLSVSLSLFVCVRARLCMYTCVRVWARACVCVQVVQQSDPTDLPPPCCWQRYGNRHTFPSPTAYETHARTNSLGLSQLGLASFSMSASLLYHHVCAQQVHTRQFDNNGALLSALCVGLCVPPCVLSALYKLTVIVMWSVSGGGSSNRSLS